MNRVILALNPKAGTYLSDSENGRAIERVLRTHYPHLEIEELEHETLADDLERLAEDPDLDILFVAGGDGTVSAAAHSLAGKDATLGIIPLGTMNLAARSLGIPPDPVKAVDALVNGRRERIDLGLAGERHFIHHISFGMHPRLIRFRNRTKTTSRLHKIWATLRSLPAILTNPRLQSYDLVIDNQPQTVRTAALIISNNLFGRNHIPYADKPNSATLGVYRVNVSDWGGLSLAAAEIMAGQIQEGNRIDVSTARELGISLPGSSKRPVRAAIDGELVKIHQHIDISIDTGALRVLCATDQ